MRVIERAGAAPERTWLAVVGTLVAALVAGSILLPRLVYDRFIWQYFWGPVYADAHGARCAVKTGSEIRLLPDAASCNSASGIVAEIGYTSVSEVGYALTLVGAVIGVVFLLRRLEVGIGSGFFYALVPFMLLGGALRVVEDANDIVPSGATAAISYPLNTLLISPIIYGTMFVLTLTALLAGLWLDRRGTVSRYEWPLAASGITVLGVTLAYLVVLASTTAVVSFYPIVTVVVLALATLITAATWYGIEARWAWLNRGTGRMGAVVVWAHMVDGVANVLITDWLHLLGVPGEYFPKHPLNEVLVAIASALVPAGILDVIGDAWPFLVVKYVAVIFILWVFDEAIFEESPRFAYLLLVAVVAVGLGPGTRDMLRATFGI